MAATQVSMLALTCISCSHTQSNPCLRENSSCGPTSSMRCAFAIVLIGSGVDPHKLASYISQVLLGQVNVWLIWVLCRAFQWSGMFFVDLERLGQAAQTWNDSDKLPKLSATRKSNYGI